MNFDYESHLILKYIGGSHAYGTNIEDSDIDYRGIIIPPKSYFYGLDHFEQHEQNSPDLVYYDIRKMVSLALRGNPNILESLYVDEYILITSYARRLIEIRDEFLTKSCLKAYIGYAQQQIYRLDVKSAPASRTERRMALVEKYGYDTKYALHIFRLLQTGIEILKEGKLRVKRPNADFLLDVRNGKFTINEIHKISKDLIEELRQAEEKSVLPESPDYHKVNRVVVEIVEDYLRENE